MAGIDDLREQLRERGYLTHGIERWFALDPWSSRAFWLELVTLALKAATLIAAFGALPPTAVMLLRNAPLGALETVGLLLSYFAVGFAAAFALVITIALFLKLRPELPIDTPRALLAISLGTSALMVAAVGAWWYGFDAAPAPLELVAGGLLSLIFFLVTTVVVSAALLSFSIYELRRIPLIHQRGRGLPIAITALILIGLLFVPGYLARERTTLPPMVVTSPQSRNIALVAVDGLTDEILASRPELGRILGVVTSVPPAPGESATERWASVGTGVKTEAHGVRAIEGIRFRGGGHVLQRVSRFDFALLALAPGVTVARREPLPAAVRRRDYVWEIAAARGVPAVAVNWWATSTEDHGALRAIGPEAVFGAAAGDPLRVDAIAIDRFLTELDRRKPRFATVYLPSLDVVLNRVERDRATQLAASLRALDGIASTVAAVRARGYEVVLIGLPGEGQRGNAILASTLPLRKAASAWDLAPSLLDLLGFPLSAEMPGSSLVSGSAQPRIATYGNRSSAPPPATMNQEYYENLKSLGYVR